MDNKIHRAMSEAEDNMKLNETAEISDDEKIDMAAESILKRFKPAFEELAKRENLPRRADFLWVCLFGDSRLSIKKGALQAMHRKMHSLASNKI